VKAPQGTLHNFLSFKSPASGALPLRSTVQSWNPNSVMQWRGRITDFSPRSRQFPKIRQHVYQQLRVNSNAFERRALCSHEATVTLKIEKLAGDHGTTLKLIGRIRAEHLAELRGQIAASAPSVLELREVTLVDAEVVRFLSACESEGIHLQHCSAYIREWIVREQESAIKG
jgi:hypothetical protein